MAGVGSEDEHDIQGNQIPGIVSFRVSELREFTGGFKNDNLLGRGVFGQVYRGTISGREDELNGLNIAVKVSFNRVKKHMWEAEIGLLSRVGGQKCIISLIGKCETSTRLFLVYPLLEGGSLHDKLEDLEWNPSLKIMIGMAEAIRFLHSQSPPIFHRDVKSRNILLDERANPILADFGMATVQQETSWQDDFSQADDIFQLGVLMLQLLMKRPMTVNPINGSDIFSWARGTRGSIMHESLKQSGCNDTIAGAVKELALECARTRGPRPSAADIHDRLQEIQQIRPRKFLGLFPF